MALKINSEPVALAQGQAQRDDPTYELEIDGKTSVALLLTNLGQTAPAGRHRLYLSADELEFQRAADSDLANWSTIFKVTSAGPIVGVNGTAINLSTLAAELQILKQYMELVLGESLLLDKVPSGIFE